MNDNDQLNNEHTNEESHPADDVSSQEEAQLKYVNPNFKWYVVRIATGKENKFKDLLDERIKREKMASFFGNILIPTEDVVELRAGQKRKVKRKFFPGYALSSDGDG